MHIISNRAKEEARGNSRHGSVGVGLGETVGDSISHPNDALYVGDLNNTAVSLAKLRRTEARKQSGINVMELAEAYARISEYLNMVEILRRQIA